MPTEQQTVSPELLKKKCIPTMSIKRVLGVARDDLILNDKQKKRSQKVQRRDFVLVDEQNLRRVRARANSRLMSALEFQLMKEHRDICHRSVARMHKHLLKKSPPRNRAEHSAAFIKLGRRPTTCVIQFCCHQSAGVTGGDGFGYDGAYRRARYTGRQRSP